MPDYLLSLIAGLLGGGIATLSNHFYQRYTEAQKLKQEVIETHLLQLQNAVESLYYRANNLLDWGGRENMTEEYYERTSVFVFARVFAHDAVLVSKGLYAKLGSDHDLKRDIKALLHQLSTAIGELGNPRLLYYHRVQLGDMAVDGDRFISFTEFGVRWNDSLYEPAVSVAKAAIGSSTDEQFEQIRHLAGDLVSRLAAKTDVPSAVELAGKGSRRADGSKELV